MALKPAICTQCGGQIEVDSTLEAGICSICETAFITEKAINNYVTQYNTTHNTQHIDNRTVIKNIVGKEMNEAEDYIKNGDIFCDLGEWGKAKEQYQKAIDIAPANPWGWFGLVKVYTENFTIYKRDDFNDYLLRYDHFHRDDFNKKVKDALKVANEQDKQKIIELCRPHEKWLKNEMRSDGFGYYFEKYYKIIGNEEGIKWIKEQEVEIKAKIKTKDERKFQESEAGLFEKRLLSMEESAKNNPVLYDIYKKLIEKNRDPWFRLQKSGIYERCYRAFYVNIEGELSYKYKGEESGKYLIIELRKILKFYNLYINNASKANEDNYNKSLNVLISYICYNIVEHSVLLPYVEGFLQVIHAEKKDLKVVKESLLKDLKNKKNNKKQYSRKFDKRRYKENIKKSKQFNEYIDQLNINAQERVVIDWVVKALLDK